MNSSLWRRMPPNSINIITKINIILFMARRSIIVDYLIKQSGTLTRVTVTIFVILHDQQSQLGMEERPDQRT